MDGTKKTIRIGVDIDDVLANFMHPLVAYHNKTYATNFVRDDFVSFDLWKTWGGTPEEAIDKVFLFYESPDFSTIDPIEGSKEAIAVLKEHHTLSIITARPEILRTKTIEWIEKHFPNTFSEIHIANKFSKTGPKLTKAEICEKNNIELLIDDSLEHALESVTSYRRVLLFDKPWNQHSELPAGITRVHSWKNILHHVQKTPRF